METNYKENLAAIDSIFYNQTLKYRINGFAEACGMHDLQIVPDSHETHKEDEEGRVVYDITTSQSYKSAYLHYDLMGIYHDLCFVFGNIIRPGEKEVLDKKVYSLKYIMILEKHNPKNIYRLTLRPETFHYVLTFEVKDKEETKTNIMTLRANLKDIDKTFKLVKLFNANPEQLFDIFKESVSSRFLCTDNRIVQNVINNVNVVEKEKIFSKSK